MAEFMDVSQLEDSIKEIESDIPMKDETETCEISNVRQNVDETGIIQYGVAGAFKEKFKLLRIANELHEISRIFLPQRFTLIDIKHDKRNDFLASMSKEYTIYFHEIQRMFEFQETTINLLQLKFKLLELQSEKRDDLFIGKMIYDQMNYLLGVQKTLKEREKTIKTVKLEELLKNAEKPVTDAEIGEIPNDSNKMVGDMQMEEISKDTEKNVIETEVEKNSKNTENVKQSTKSEELSKDTNKTVTEEEDHCTDAEKIVEETFDCFSRYLEAYKKCAFFIADTFDKAAEKNSYLLKSIQNLFDSISILEEYSESYNSISESSNTISDTNESSINTKTKMTIEDLFNKIDFLITVTEKAEFAYTEIKRLVFELITFE